MDCLHHEPEHRDTRTGRDCRFCQHWDPEFGKRNPMDRLVSCEWHDTASVHMTEDGYVKHRMPEIRVRLSATGFRPLPGAV
jgi:hypothetical protein